ncbi:MAG: glycine--tRNA ligase subunit beta [Cycloclasticus sp.]|nr:glycine--tRNA ligase subunit beta [Cycloclasticus sp.]MBQ0789752.1 glycine--tRNA ligase subunit beta [Cycloclasticus sp.]
MSNNSDLLFELGCEELPPTHLKTLRDSLLQAVCEGLDEAKLAYGKTHAYATPRRLAFWVESVDAGQQDAVIEKRGPAVVAAYGADGQPSKAALGFAKSCGADFSELKTLKTEKGEWLCYNKLEPGQSAETLIPAIIEKALARLPIAKRMRWGDSDSAFVRPVHWAGLLFGGRVINAQFFGINTSNTSVGHRFHAPESFTISSAASYSDQLRQAYVFADVEQRRQTIVEQAEQAARAVGGQAYIDAELLDEVTALVEYPVAVTGSFDEHFLTLPKEVLITTMQTNQKYFPVLSKQGDLLPFFITISNIQSSNPTSVSHGNERVIRPRLSDAEFFWQQDNKLTLEQRVDSLNSVVFQHKLGSLGEKTTRVTSLSSGLAKQLGYDVTLAARAALLSKTDLVTDMVGEFASLQGVIGRYYATENGEPSGVATAIEEQYLPKLSGGSLPSSETGQVLALADKLDTVVGIFSIGLLPTGDKDPFALRRASLGILRIIIENNLALDLKTLISQCCDQFTHAFDANSTQTQVLSFMLDRLKGYCLNKGFSAEHIAAVASISCSEPVDFMNRLQAVKDFSTLPEAASLSDANKRIQNLLKKAPTNISDQLNPDLLSDAAEIELYQQLLQCESLAQASIEQQQYLAALKSLSSLKGPIDAFFEHVFIMVDDEPLKNSRLALLSKIHANFIKVANISMI